MRTERRSPGKIMYLYVAVPLAAVTIALLIYGRATSPGERATKEMAEERHAEDSHSPEDAAIITAISSGLSGLMGAIAQSIIAFMNSRRLSEDKDEGT